MKKVFVFSRLIEARIIQNNDMMK